MTFRLIENSFPARTYHTNLIVVLDCLESVTGRHQLLLGIGGGGVHWSLSDKYTVGCLEPDFYWRKNRSRPWSSAKGISVNYLCWTSINTHFCRYHTPILLTVKLNQAAAHKLLCTSSQHQHVLTVSLWASGEFCLQNRFHSNRNYALKNHRPEPRLEISPRYHFRTFLLVFTRLSRNDSGTVCADKWSSQCFNQDSRCRREQWQTFTCLGSRFDLIRVEGSNVRESGNSVQMN